MLEIIDLMTCLRSSVRISVPPNYWYHSKYGIPGYAHNNWYRSISISVTTQLNSHLVFTFMLSLVHLPASLSVLSTQDTYTVILVRVSQVVFVCSFMVDVSEGVTMYRKNASSSSWEKGDA